MPAAAAADAPARGILTWSALTWRDRLAVLRVGVGITCRADLEGRNATCRADLKVRPYEDTSALTVREWLIAHGQTPRLIELLWEPLAVAALNQPIDIAAAARFSSSCAGCSPAPDAMRHSRCRSRRSTGCMRCRRSGSSNSTTARFA